LLAKVYDVDAEVCPDCKGKLKPVGAVTKKDDAIAMLNAGLSVLPEHTPESTATGPPRAA